MIQLEEKIDIDSLLEGNYAAFENVVNTFKNKVVNLCYSYVNNTDDAEDIAQETFIELYKTIKKFKKQSSLSTWIYRIASNKSIDFIRSKKRVKRGHGKISYLEDHQNIQEWGVPGSEQADERIIQQQRKELLYDALEKLSSKQKEAYVLTQIEGLDQKTTADILETTVKSVESLVIRAKKKLKQILEKRIKEFL
ncbi:RNA polymerase sigma factor [Plebeiibacterium sediminum]|uniref:RNA polymerase sigma factor n=1 Tax=Plebeiibacterium sediminum TaxID=2992112 RepID=A0AAE3M8R0_9BACT|nr:RNA polymerase sigma factor [Plebeiobacterium sediminum]MCW3788650.1 RNA polymerase sigma factor [Plebeiobacterium sediminum]